ncbi:DUF928 domain-containing protein [Rivularia sp. UHCC 0363]|uniref:DUF928 domain-containing protein n=1 Tax=Rivularia sp. UHCC 0363 TaxID=3110244 RepID=UPI002B21CAAF|nr:DUF928 domain-containing protein [Rivularia sp. UHCC 0363]MEA5598203.1 DUF928 domain-containing protein [Rivularia sp. UHCC 0363]
MELAKDLKIAKTPFEKILVYAKYNIWYEAITDLAKLRLTEPNNFIFKKTWIDFFTKIIWIYKTFLKNQLLEA